MICLRVGKTYTAKIPPGDFKVTTPENPLLSQQVLQVKESQCLIPTYNWTLTPMPNWTFSVVTISSCQCTAPSTWLTNRCADPSTRLYHQLEKDVGYKVLQFINTMKITKLLGHKIQRRTNVATSSKGRWNRANFAFSYNLREQNFAYSRDLWRLLK